MITGTSFPLQDRVAIVTGASRGIGKAIALALAKEGAKVVVAARTEVEGRLPGTIHKTVEEIEAFKGSGLAIKTDVTKEEEVDEMVRKTVDHFGSLDVLVNNAGIYVPDRLAEIPNKRWDLAIAVNIRGTFLCTKAALPHMIKQARGSIINISSLFGTRVISGGIAYGVTKAAIERFTQGLAQEVRQYNIAVNALCPGMTDTEGARMRSPDVDRSLWQEPEMWGRYAVFLASQHAGSLTGKCFTTADLEELTFQTHPKP